MLKRCPFPGIYFIAVLLVMSPLCSFQVFGASSAEQGEAYGEWLASLPGGWINAIGNDEIIIDDTVYLFGDETTFDSDRGELVEGVFVKYEMGIENYLARILVAEPTEDDMDMRPIDRSGDGEESTGATPREGEPKLENGVWVN